MEEKCGFLYFIMNGVCVVVYVLYMAWSVFVCNSNFFFHLKKKEKKHAKTVVIVSDDDMDE